jgi:hypothetical protein
MTSRLKEVTMEEIPDITSDIIEKLKKLNINSVYQLAVQAVVEDDGEFVPNKPNPYCDKVKSGESEGTGVCHDRFDYEDGDFASCNDGSQREDPEDCPDATESESNDEDSNSNERDPYETKNDNDIPGCQNGVIQKCVIKEIGLICNLEDRYAPINPNVVGGGHACQDIYAGNYIYEPESVLKTCKDGTLAKSCGLIGYG